ncbi:MAG TPA: hypothetical protein DIU00_21400 [Phycisphaerales bacterium]|nr:hypothetical protein [Phycisphaerales bacterium]
MRNEILCGMVLLLWTGLAHGVTPIGPATSDLDQGQFAIGFDYSNGDFETDYENLIATYSGLGTIVLPDKSISADLEGYFGKVSYGIKDRWLVFARFGQVDIDSEKDFTYGLGTKITLKESDELDLGLTAQINFLTNDESFSDSDWEYAEGELDFYVAQIALGPVYKSDKFRLYGGPFVDWADGDGDLSGRLIYEGTPIDVKARFDLKTELELGGYIGMSLEIAENLDIMAEYQITDNWDIFGAGLQFKF